MLYYLYELWLESSGTIATHFSPLRVLKYITVRAFLAAGISFLIVVLLGPRMIALLKRFRFRQYIRKEEAPPLHVLHGQKEGTPTMGGLLIAGAVIVTTLFCAMPSNIYVLLALATLAYMTMVGFWDDYLKIRHKTSKGLSARAKLVLQLIWCIAFTYALLSFPETKVNTAKLMVPFIKYPVIETMSFMLTLVFLSLIIVGSTNAVNLTDGLDGLAIGCSGSVALSYLIMAYAAGHIVIAEYLMIPYVSGAGELSVLCGSILGASLGFLWYNCHPAQVFMGDTGSLGLGGVIAAIAILVKQELVLVIVGGVFVVEALSVIIQVISFKTTGKRVFKCSPIHHHFELKDWSETQVVVRFWIVSIIFALIGVLTLKIR